MVIESPPLALTPQEKSARRRHILKRHGIVRTANRLLFNWFRSRFINPAETRTVKDIFFPNGRPAAYIRNVPTVTVANINDSACLELVKLHAPDLLAVCGTSLIKPELFSLAPRGAVNIHTGITPHYRSANPIFWAIYNNEPDKVGVTIHFVDEGIDTGPIIHQTNVPLYCNDSMATIYARCIRRGAELYLRALSEIEAGSVQTPDRTGADGKAFYSINLGIFQYMVFRWRFRKLKRHLPRGDEPAATPVVEARR